MANVTPNIDLQVPSFNQPNWNVPIVYDLNLIDLIFGGSIVVPALNVTTLTAGNISGVFLPPSIAETPTGAVPGSVYTLSYAPNPLAMLVFTINGVAQRPSGPNADFSVTGNIVTLNNPTPSGATVYAQYFYNA